MAHQLTNRQLREALAAFPDDLPVVVSVDDGTGFAEDFLITDGPAYGQVDWGNGPVLDTRRIVLGSSTDHTPDEP